MRERPAGLALITGASAGIGLAFAEHLAQRGFDLALVARRRERLELVARDLEERHGISVLTLPHDLSKPEAPGQIMEALRAAGLRVDVLVNNVGYGHPRPFVEMPWGEVAHFLEVLAISQVKLTHLVLPGMRDRGQGHILNIASVAAHVPEIPGSLYHAVKKFLVSFSRAIRLENQAAGIKVTAVCPGYTRSEFHDVLGNRKQMNTLPTFMWQDAEAVAREGWRACERNQAVVTTGWVNKVIQVLCHVLPERLLLMLAPKASRGRELDT